MGTKARIHLCMIIPTFLCLLTALVMADDVSPPDKPAPVKKPMIEFKDEMVIGKGDSDKAKASYTVTISLEGVTESSKITIYCEGRSASAEANLSALEAQVSGPRKGVPSDWKYNLDRNRLTIEGWTDPKTKKFHRVTVIKFESPDFDKKYWPTITLPSNETSD
jgi:hypothetical protein